MKPTSAGGKPDFIAAGVAGLSAAGISPKEQANWEKKLKEARDNVKRLLGNHKIDELTFTFTENKEDGEVSTVSKVKVLFTLKVISEGDKWKIEQR